MFKLQENSSKCSLKCTGTVFPIFCAFLTLFLNIHIYLFNKSIFYLKHTTYSPFTEISLLGGRNSKPWNLKDIHMILVLMFQLYIFIYLISQYLIWNIPHIHHDLTVVHQVGGRRGPSSKRKLHWNLLAIPFQSCQQPSQ